MDTKQMMEVAVHFDGHWSTREKFFGQISKDGRIAIPKLTCRLLKDSYGDGTWREQLLRLRLHLQTERWTNKKTNKRVYDYYNVSGKSLCGLTGFGFPFFGFFHCVFDFLLYLQLV
jgi:hypothetical protein